MFLGLRMIRVPLALQVGAVAALFVAASATLWLTGSSVVRREERRADARRSLDSAADGLVERAARELAGVRAWPERAEPDELAERERALARTAGAVLAGYDGIEGGYFLRDEGRFLPDFPAARRGATSEGSSRDEADLFDLVETQVDAAIRKRRGLSVVEDVAPRRSVAVRTAPVRVNGSVVAAAWTMTELSDPLFLDRSRQGYRISAGLALGGIALSMTLTLGLARTVRKQAGERDRLQAELRRSERLAALGKLLAGVAHEVRNPLAGIRSTAQLWQRGIGLDEESLADLVAEVDRLDALVSRLLQFSRADAQAMAPGDVNGVVAEAARLVPPSAEARGVRVEVDLDPALPTALIAPPALLQVFRNLTANALRAMPDGGTIRIATAYNPSRRAIEATVSDTGTGLSPGALRHLFEPFFTTKADGTGLGLAIAREVALAHRGELRAENRTNGPGAVFTLTLPVAAEERRR